HSHVFLGSGHAANERRTWIVVGLTLAFMVVEIGAGMLFQSMALIADGWHMATHAAALAIAAFAYRFASRHAQDARFSFGTGKVGDLAGYTSAVILGLVALLIAWESAQRLIDPRPIAFAEALAVAVAGLIVNLASAALLASPKHGHGKGHATHGHDHGHSHSHSHNHDLDHPDHNLTSAYAHVLADALTSILAILALGLGLLWNWRWLDAVIGLVGAAVILTWSVGLMRDAAGTLLDVEADGDLAASIRQTIEADPADRIADLHLWRVGPGQFAVILSIVTDRTMTVEGYRALLAGDPRIRHLTIEIQPCCQAA
ncbi:MAG: CDF family Co(II)/Ni(II) efflux transporter DmeF, partial [Rhodospirillales bacterium]|nr:CDF family Co(II)/Ni(II) efflux transporter DmeF [Rhodospirillales bacterium]